MKADVCIVSKKITRVNYFNNADYSNCLARCAVGRYMFTNLIKRKAIKF
jgi:hypothetical protein